MPGKAQEALSFVSAVCTLMMFAGGAVRTAILNSP